jgi:hypothetical protein
MKVAVRIVIALIGVIVISSIGITIIGYFVEKSQCKAPFYTTFLQKDIRFPISAVDASKKYDLEYDSLAVRGMSSTENDTLMIADSKKNAFDVYGLVFYLREQSPKAIQTLIAGFEKQYGKKFVDPPNEPYPLFQYMQINDCMYLCVDFNQYGTNEVFKTLSTKKITCRVGFYYGLSESELIYTSADGRIGIIGRGY